MIADRDNNLARLTRYYALMVGVMFTLAGIGGFLPVITQPPPVDAPPLTIDLSYGLLLGLFPVNVLHNLFHLAIGVFGLASARSAHAARFFAKVLAISLGVLTLMGLAPIFNTTFGLFPLFGHDIWLHGLEAVIAAYLGFVAPSRTQSYHPYDSPQT